MQSISNSERIYTIPRTILLVAELAGLYGVSSKFTRPRMCHLLLQRGGFSPPQGPEILSCLFGEEVPNEVPQTVPSVPTTVDSLPAVETPSDVISSSVKVEPNAILRNDWCTKLSQFSLLLKRNLD